MSTLSIDAVRDALPLSEAASRAQVSRERIRGWLRRGHLSDYRDQEGRRFVSWQELIDLCRKRGVAPPADDTGSGHGQPAPGALDVLGDLRGLIQDLRSERDRLLEERDRAWQEIERLRERLSAFEGPQGLLISHEKASADLRRRDEELADLEELLQKGARKGWSAEKVLRRAARLD